MKARRATSTHEALRRTTAPREGQPKPKAKASGDRFSTINGMIDLHFAEMQRTDALLWVVLWRFVDSKTGTATVSHARLAELLGLTRRGVVKATTRMAKAGYIKVVRKGGPNHTANIYQLTNPPTK